jgi:hypothetical protein
MPAGGLYSERFIISSGSGFRGYTVPEFKRAIIKDVMAFNNNASTSTTGYLIIAGVTVWAVSLPASTGALHVVTYQVAYALETVQVYTPAGTPGWAVSGYLFDDPTRSGHPRSDHERMLPWEAGPTPEQLPT